VKNLVTVLRDNSIDLAKLLFEPNPSLIKAFSDVSKPFLDAAIVSFFFFLHGLESAIDYLNFIKINFSALISKA
jgi:hypothetical protein